MSDDDFEYEYDDKRLSYEKFSMSSSKQPITKRYSYLKSDDKGNWVEMLVYENNDDDPCELRVRTYKYYDE